MQVFTLVTHGAVVAELEITSVEAPLLGSELRLSDSGHEIGVQALNPPLRPGGLEISHEHAQLLTLGTAGTVRLIKNAAAAAKSPIHQSAVACRGYVIGHKTTVPGASASQIRTSKFGAAGNGVDPDELIHAWPGSSTAHATYCTRKSPPLSQPGVGARSKKETMAISG